MRDCSGQSSVSRPLSHTNKVNMERNLRFLVVAGMVIFASTLVVIIIVLSCIITKDNPTEKGIKDSDTSQSSSQVFYYKSPSSKDNRKIHHILVNKAHPGNCPTWTATALDDEDDDETHFVVKCGATCHPSNHLSRLIFADNEVAVLKSNNSCLQIQKSPMTSDRCKFKTSLTPCGYGQRYMFWFHSEDSTSTAFRRVHTAFDLSCKGGVARLALRQKTGGLEGITLEPHEEGNDEFLWKEVRCME